MSDWPSLVETFLTAARGRLRFQEPTRLDWTILILQDHTCGSKFPMWVASTHSKAMCSEVLY